MDSKKKYEEMVEDGDIIPTYAKELYEISKIPPPMPRPKGVMMVPDEAMARELWEQYFKANSPGIYGWEDFEIAYSFIMWCYAKRIK